MAALDSVEEFVILLKRRYLPSQAKVRSTNHRRGSNTKPRALSLRLTISKIQENKPATNYSS